MSATDEPKGASGAGFESSSSEPAPKTIPRHKFVETGTRYCGDCREPFNNLSAHFTEVGFDETTLSIAIPSEVCHAKEGVYRKYHGGRLVAEVCDTYALGEVVINDKDRAAAVDHDLWFQNVNLRLENERLKRGDFTPAEFQNLCHSKTVQDGFEVFVTGCHEFQKQLFGVSADEVVDEVERLKDAVVEAAVEDYTADENWPEAADKLGLTVKALLDYRDIKQTPKRMNYRALLLKYITFVSREEGSDCINFLHRSNSFSDDEWSELERLSNESLNDPETKVFQNMNRDE